MNKAMRVTVISRFFSRSHIPHTYKGRNAIPNIIFRKGMWQTWPSCGDLVQKEVSSCYITLHCKQSYSGSSTKNTGYFEEDFKDRTQAAQCKTPIAIDLEYISEEFIDRYVDVQGTVLFKGENYLILDNGKFYVRVNWKEDMNEFMQLCTQKKYLQLHGYVRRKKNFEEIETDDRPVLIDLQSIVKIDGKKFEFNTSSDYSGSSASSSKVSINHLSTTPFTESEKYSKKIHGLDNPDVNKYCLRSHSCGNIIEHTVGKTVTLMGWVKFYRMKRFIILKDCSGEIQIAIDDDKEEEFQGVLKNISEGSVIHVIGTVRRRPLRDVNPELGKRGWFEVAAKEIAIMNRAKSLPLSTKGKESGWEVKLKYRFLDIRLNDILRGNLIFRSNILHKIRKFLIEKARFAEVETPTLFRRNPGGAQEFIVPTRNPGQYYSLVQSPQLFKQLLMVGGIERYFQMARCYRDETIRPDRQPEFTQLDIEMSFCTRELVMKLVEDLLVSVWPAEIDLQVPFPIFRYEDVMNQYGSDKPDLRFNWKIRDVTNSILELNSSKLEGLEKYKQCKNFNSSLLVVKEGLQAKKKAKEIFKILRNNENFAHNHHAFLVEIVDHESMQNFLHKVFSPQLSFEKPDWNPGDLVILGLGEKQQVLDLIGRFRKEVSLAMVQSGIKVYDDSKPFSFLWVYDFPLFEEVNNKLQSVHHPFTQPHPDDEPLLKTDPLKVRALSYDLVLNGYELGGGSIRIMNPDLQRMILQDILQLDLKPFECLLEALSLGAPIHGGIAIGIDRLIAILCSESNIADVIAFPKSHSGRDMMSGAPCDIPNEDKKLYHL